MTTSKKFEQVISVVVICSTSSSSKKAMENNFKLNATKNLENTQRTKNPKKCNLGKSDCFLQSFEEIFRI